MVSLLKRLIEKGDCVSVENGKLCILPASGKLVPEVWYGQNSSRLALDLAGILNQPVLLYDGHCAGRFEAGKYPGLSIFLKCASTGTRMYSIFNVEMNRARTTKYGAKGTPLPRGSFRVGKRSSLMKLWEALKMTLPPRCSSIHDYIGNLKYRLFTYEVRKGNKISSTELVPLNVMPLEILEALNKLPDKGPAISIQNQDRCQTILPYKEPRGADRNKGVQENFSTCPGNYEKSNQKEVYNSLNTITPREPVQNQSNEEWLADYNRSVH